ncbi:hypothetical protein EAF04_007855 [Stromatinia cepivora]|nr:hypothetical protein EAF04_007855 [Stromatinia cepivora]
MGANYLAFAAREPGKYLGKLDNFNNFRQLRQDQQARPLWSVTMNNGSQLPGFRRQGTRHIDITPVLYHQLLFASTSSSVLRHQYRRQYFSPVTFRQYGSSVTFRQHVIASTSSPVFHQQVFDIYPAIPF